MIATSFTFKVKGGFCEFHTADYTRDELIKHYKRQRARGLPAYKALEYARSSAHSAAVAQWMALYE